MNALLALLVAASLAAAPLSPPPYDESRASVARVVDGDTVVVRIALFYERIVRYIGIDAPESTRRRDCFGEQASEIHRQVVSGKVLRLERDTSEVDRFGRLLRYAYLADGTMVNEVLVRMGAALARSYPPDTKHQERLKLAESQARAEGRGLWSACRAAPPTPTATPTARPPAATVTVNVEKLRVRSGPGTNYEQLGELSLGETVQATGRSADGRWWQIIYQGKAAWISADYVAAAPEAYVLPLAGAPPQPAPPVMPPPAIAPPSATSGCPTGCTARQPGCDIKGNVNSRGERIYHVPGSTHYDRTSVRPEQGDRWFCTPAEAEANGFRAPKR